jgi:hypothetical protein
MVDDKPVEKKTPTDKTTTPEKPAEDSLWNSIMEGPPPSPTAEKPADKPAATAEKPPATAEKPPATADKPAAADKPATADKPAVADKPVAPAIKDNVQDNPLFGPAVPPAADKPAVPPAADKSAVPATADEPLSPSASDVKPIPPAVDVPVTGDKVVPPGDKPIIEPALKATVDDKIAKLVQHINNGASLLKEGRIEETVNAYRAAGDLVSPEEQKVFLQEQQKVAELIKAEKLKPADQQDVAKLQEMKQLERNLRTLGLVDVFTEVNSGLIYTQTGDLGKASEAFAKAFSNEKSLVDAKVLPELYLKNDPNLGIRIGEISKNLGVDVRQVMADSAQKAGIDPKLVGFDTGRGPPAAEPEVVPPAVAPDKVKTSFVPGQEPSESVPPTITPEKAPAVTPEKAPAVTPEKAPVVTPEKAPVVTPEKAPAVTPEKAPAVTPELAPAVTPEKAPAATPELAPAVTPEKAPPPRVVEPTGEVLAVDKGAEKPATDKPPAVAAPGDKAVEAPVLFSPADTAGRVPIDRAKFWIEQARAKELTPEIRKEITAAIAAADQGVSPNLVKLEKHAVELKNKRAEMLDKPAPGSTVLLADAVTKVDSKILGKFEEKVVDGSPTYVQTEAGSIDKLVPPAKYPMQEEFKKAVPPAEYKPATAKPADSKLSDEEYRTEQFRNDLRTQNYRAGIKALYAGLDEATDDASFKDTLEKLKEKLPPDAKDLIDSIDERNRLTTEIRPVQFDLNATNERIPLEKNQSSSVRMMFADLLFEKKDVNGAKQYAKEAYAWNQLPNYISEYRNIAMSLEVSPYELLEAAVKQNQDRGGGKKGKCLEVENLLQEANLMYAAAPEANKAAVAAKLTPSIEAIQKMADREAAEVSARTQALISDYEKTLPSDPKLVTELKQLEQKMGAAETKFTPPEQQLIANSLDPALSPEDRAKAKEELRKTQGQWIADSERYNTILGDKGLAYTEVKSKIAFHMLDVRRSGENSFFSRGIQANMLAETGNKEGAKAKLTEAFGAIPAAARGKLLETRPMVAQLTTALGLDVNAMKALPEPKVAALPPSTVATDKPPVVAGAVPPADGAKPPTDGAKPPAPGDKPPVTADKPVVEGEKPKPNNIPKDRRLPVEGANPRFLSMSDQELDKAISDRTGKLDQVQQVKDMYTELIKRYDSDLTKEQFKTSIPAQKLLLEALKAGKELDDGPNGTRIVGKTDLTEERRWDYHAAVYGDMESLGNQVRARLEFAQFLKSSGQFEDAEKMGLEARDYSERLMTGVDINGQKVRPIDLIQEEAVRLADDQLLIGNENMRSEMTKASRALKGTNLDTGVLKTPINTNKFLAQLYLGSEVVPKYDGTGQIVGIAEVQFGKSSAFKPDKAYEASQKALAYTRELLKLDPLDAKTAKDNPGVASLFGVLTDMIDKPERYKLYVTKAGETYVNEKGETVPVAPGSLKGVNDSGKPILIEANSVENLKNQIKKDSTLYSMLVDGMVAVGVVGGVALARTKNPQVLAFFEKGLGRFTSNPQVARQAIGVGSALTVTALGRHYGYKALTGVDESWTDSILHTAGSLAAAEVGGRMSGRGSLITGRSAGAPQFAKMTEESSAKFLERQGYETSGQVMDLLKSQGYIAEAGSFVGINRGTRLFNAAGHLDEAVAKAFKEANLKGARMGNVSEAIVADVKLSSGIKTDALAAKVAEVPNGAKTIGDLEKMIEADQTALKNLAEHTTGLDPKMKIADMVAGKTEAAELITIAEKYGLKDVKAVRDLATESHKIGFDKVFPKLAEMRSGNLINSSTMITDAVKMGTHALEGPGLQRVLSMVPAGERAAMFTEKGLAEVMAANPVTGSRSLWERTKDGYSAIKSATSSSWNAVSTRDGWTMMRTAVGDTLKPLTTKNFYTTTAPGALYDAGAFGMTRLNSARKVVTDRFEFRAIDPTKATPEALSRARFAGGFYGGLGAAGTYNTIVKPYDMTGQVFGVTLPQGGDKHAVYTNEDGSDMSWTDALIESHFPSVSSAELGAGEMNWYQKNLLVPGLRAVLGTPGQALFGSQFLKPGAIYKPVWANPQTGTFRKSMQSVFPLSPTRWNNWNAKVFSNPTMSTAGMFTGALVPATVDAVGPALGVDKYQQMLKNLHKKPTNKELPEQRIDLDDPSVPGGTKSEVKPVTPAEVKKSPDDVPPKVTPTVKPGAKPADKPTVKPQDGKPAEPPPPGIGY